MKYMTTAEIREKYLSFFEEKGCKRMPSSSLIPDDPSLLLTSAGMVQFKPYFLHQKELDSAYIGTTTVQKCVRTNDIENIGDARHLSFFEMLGNFSFGKYFKSEMCAWAYEFCTQHLGLPAEKLYFTVFEDDDETIEIWKGLGVPEDHISKLGEEDNFWRAGPTGPCGPCSEIYFDQGPEVGCGSPDCKPGCDCDRYLEFWNCVFTQYDGQEDGTLAPLQTKNIDTGMGLERIAAIMQGVTNNYDTDVLRSLVAMGEELSGKAYAKDTATDACLRIMADHSRSVTFMMADGILPSNEGRGYVLRRLLRRAVMKGHSLGIEGAFLEHYINKIISLYGSVYPELVENEELIKRAVLSEEERFGATLRQGQAYLDDALSTLEGKTLAGATAFVLHDTYGFPVEITQEICEERGYTVDMEEFARCMEEQRERARAANVKDAEAAWSTYGGIHAELLKELGATKFVGYNQLVADAKVCALVKEGARATELSAGDEAEVILDVTPFYAEMGGEVGDTGHLVGDEAVLEVTDTKAPEKGLVCHKVKVVSGSIKVGTQLSAKVDGKRRARISRNHTCTHILHASLRQVLGAHVKQAGSYVGPDRLRFDFTHFEAVTPAQIKEVEKVANDVIMQAISTNIFETSLAKAREAGVTALFGEKYGDTVRVVEVGDFSQELCGGCHVANTAEIGLVKIVSESSVGSNLRRIEALTSYDAIEYLNSFEAQVKELSSTLRVPTSDVVARVEANVAQLRELNSKSKANKAAAAGGDLPENLLELTVGSEYPVFVHRKDGLDAGGMRNFWDIVRSRLPEGGACVLASNNDGTPILLAAGTDEAVAKGFNAGAVIKEIACEIKGGGGGKPSMAQAGGKDASGIDAALEAARKLFA
jgi:alanyl-tRNA synthetase